MFKKKKTHQQLILETEALCVKYHSSTDESKRAKLFKKIEANVKKINVTLDEVNKYIQNRN